MKKLIGTILSCIMILSFAGCGNNENDANVVASAGTAQATEVEDDVTRTDPVQTEKLPQENEQSADIKEEADPESSNILILYFSRTGEQYTVGVIDMLTLIRIKQWAGCFEDLFIKEDIFHQEAKGK